jgi:methyltransferase (TIGR00027 family)
MKEGTASHTARAVAAHRLTYDRVAAGYGDPAADEALSRDVADGLTPGGTRMREYLRVRTAFFDRMVVNAVDRGITQVVTGGAGYDGRAFRYARPGIRWFEVDHPATQADKRARLARLGLDAAHIAFIPADSTADPVAGPLRDAGLDPARPVLTVADAAGLLSAAGWATREASDGQRSAGLLLAEAATAVPGTTRGRGALTRPLSRRSVPSPADDDSGTGRQHCGSVGP